MVDGFHESCDGRNGGGDPWHTDGRLAIVTLRLSGKVKDDVMPAKADIQ